MGPFSAKSAKEAFEKEFGPEKNSDTSASYEDGNLRWSERSDLGEGAEWGLPGGQGAHYLLRTVSVVNREVVEVEIGIEPEPRSG